jgi:hypothetical protein
MAASPDNSSKWWDKLRRRPPATTAANPDVVVAAWKTAWSEGANAAWAPQRAYNNPYPTGAQRSAWDAGWRWAGRNPDRRNNEAVRMAHPLRRSTDTALTPSLKRAAALGATGVTLYAISKMMRRWLNNGR